jgi:hypothetical protein
MYFIVSKLSRYLRIIKSERTTEGNLPQKGSGSARGRESWPQKSAKDAKGSRGWMPDLAVRGVEERDVKAVEVEGTALGAAGVAF